MIDNIYISRDAVTWDLYGDDIAFWLYLRLISAATPAAANPGTAYCPAHLARALCKSPAKFKRAMQRLQNEGLVTTTPGGYLVTECRHVRFTVPDDLNAAPDQAPDRPPQPDTQLPSTDEARDRDANQLALLRQRVTLLQQLLDEKERLIRILLTSRQ